MSESEKEIEKEKFCTMDVSSIKLIQKFLKIFI